MNVAFDAWVPVVTSLGERKLVSLCEVFIKGEQLADLAVRPHERVALMRLFLCVAHAALEGPKDYDEWCEVPKDLPAAAEEYLEKWKDSFELFHPEKPWLQVASLKKDSHGKDGDIASWTNAEKLNFGFATGNNTTLFDHCGGSESRHVDVAGSLLSLLTFQCFSPGGLISQIYWNGVQSGN